MSTVLAGVTNNTSDWPGAPNPPSLRYPGWGPPFGPGNVIPNCPVNADPTIPNAATPVYVTMLEGKWYCMIADGGALSRPTASFPASFTFPTLTPYQAFVQGTEWLGPVMGAGTRFQLSLCEAQALCAAGGARLS
jgi:hypothetical protein